jgi:hypothetical protein
MCADEAAAFREWQEEFFIHGQEAARGLGIFDGVDFTLREK